MNGIQRHLWTGQKDLCVCVCVRVLKCATFLSFFLLLLHSVSHPHVSKCSFSLRGSIGVMDCWQVPHTGDTRYQTTTLPIQTHFNHSLPVITCFLTLLGPILPCFLLCDRLLDFSLRRKHFKAHKHTLAPLIHTEVEPLTFECVFVKFFALCVCLSDGGGDSSDNGLPTLIDYIWGAGRRQHKGLGYTAVDSWQSSPQNTYIHTNKRTHIITRRAFCMQRWKDTSAHAHFWQLTPGDII